MIGIITERRGWIWLVLYLVDFLERFVCDISQFICLLRSNFLINQFLTIVTCGAAVQKANKRSQGVCTEGLFRLPSYSYCCIHFALPKPLYLMNFVVC